MTHSALHPDSPPAAPRPVRAGSMSGGTRFLLLFGGIWLVVGAVLTAVFLGIGQPFWVDLALDERGVSAEARPTHVERTQSSQNGRVVHEVSFRFRFASGAEGEGMLDTTDEATIERANRHEPLLIEYDPEAPSRVRLKGQQASFFGYLALIPTPFFLIGGLIAGIGWVKLRRVRRIYVHGASAPGVVASVSPTAMRINRRRVMRVEYTFEVGGRAHRGETSSVTPPAVGTPLWVIYDTADPAQNVAA